MDIVLSNKEYAILTSIVKKLVGQSGQGHEPVDDIVQIAATDKLFRNTTSLYRRAAWARALYYKRQSALYRADQLEMRYYNNPESATRFIALAAELRNLLKARVMGNSWLRKSIDKYLTLYDLLIAGCDQVEIAKHLNMSQQNVSRLIQNIREILKLEKEELLLCV